MKRPLFVFAGQSNMMGACVYDAKEQIYYKNSYEYLHKAKRFGAQSGQFKQEGFPVGEFSYMDLAAAYGDNTDPAVGSTLVDYIQNTFFCPSMTNLAEEETKTLRQFCEFSEATAPQMAPSIAPYIVSRLEAADLYCAYTHAAKGGVTIGHYLEGGAKDYFYQKVADFFADCEKRFSDDDLSERVCVWLQGESDNGRCSEDYYADLTAFWSRLKSAGFTKLMIIRVPFWNRETIWAIMKAQEDFCRDNNDAYIITRAASFIPWRGQNRDGWFDGTLPEEYEMCRDSFFGYENQHLNEKAFCLIADRAVPNIIRILDGDQPILEEELILPLK